MYRQANRNVGLFICANAAHLTLSCSAVPDPSSDSQTWWQDLEINTFAEVTLKHNQQRNLKVANPFDSDFFATQPAVSTAERFKADLPRFTPISDSRASKATAAKRKAPPTIPANKPVMAEASPTYSPNTGTLGTSIMNGSKLTLQRKASTSSLLDDEDAGHTVISERPDTHREATSEWQVISPNPAKQVGLR